MKYIIVLALLLTAACSFVVVDTRSDTQRAATRTAISALPYSAIEGRLHIRVLSIPPVTVEPHVVPNEASLLPTVTPDGFKAAK